MRATALILGIMGLLLAQEAFANKEHLPLPPKVLNAKSVYIDNRSGIAALGDRAFQELKKWGRFDIVQEKKQADVIILLSAKEYNGGYVTTGGGENGKVDDNGNISTTANPTYTTPVTVGYTFMTVIDPATGDSLWSDSKRWGNLLTGFHSATKGLVDELRKRIDEQTQNSKKPH